MPVEHIQPSAKARDQLIVLKRRTGIENWNTLCRWALCVSLAESSRPPEARHPADSPIQMDWRTFAGSLDEVYWAVLKERCAMDGLDSTDEEVVGKEFRLHLHRGISYLAGDKAITNVADLVRRALSESHAR